MALFQSYISPSLPHGVYAVSVPPPATILPVGTGVAVEVGQFPWGPSNALTYPGSMGSFWQTFAPAGMSRLGSAHLATIRKGWPLLGGVRVADPAAAVATCVIQTSGSVTVMTVTAKYSGTAGNSIIITIAAPNDGIATLQLHGAGIVGIWYHDGVLPELQRGLVRRCGGSQRYELRAPSQRRVHGERNACQRLHDDG